MKKVSGGALFVTMLIVIMASSALALRSYLTDFNNQYGTSATPLNTCGLCHPGGTNTAGNLNDFANDYVLNGYSYTAIQNLDSDGDGFTNIQEINARTLPGDPASFPVADSMAPTVTVFVVPATAITLVVPITSFIATDNVGVTGYLLTETPTVPSPGSAGWTLPAPTSYTFVSAGSKTLYAWAKDAAGNVSVSATATVIVTTTSTTSSMLYATFTGAGIYQYNGTTWSRLSPGNPIMMVTSGSNLYASFTGNGIYMHNGTAWSQLTSGTPVMMVASGTNLYASYTGSGIYMHNGTAWSQITPGNPEKMLTSNNILYADFGANGLYQYNGTIWSQLTTGNPADMVVGN